MNLAGLWLTRSLSMCLLLQSFVLMILCFHSASMCPKGCTCSHSGGLNVSCSNANLKEIPKDLPPDTTLLSLDSNRITSIPDGIFKDLHQLRELNLSKNIIESVGEHAFKGLEETLQALDLSYNKITTVHKNAFASLKAKAHIGNNPWHCDCTLQQVLKNMVYNHESASRVICKTSELHDHAGRPFLKADADLCNLTKRTTDYAMLVTMFGWFTMVISYVVYYVRQNQEDARRHLEYLKSLPSKQKKPDETDDISTVV
ncbi:LRC3B protein, partial [Atractosteus spatula]|uniref:Leucine rich repeat containing 3B n=2 Tax=Lepisosteidae TaxID=7915 RepID=W5NP74_LEPOC|nr:PREDICTED: leucine-rich repeat-containing protein 3B [Lepisosteus oculatus]MBN3325673.1 LRC3B protein [Atractosteus spatula]